MGDLLTATLQFWNAAVNYQDNIDWIQQVGLVESYKQANPFVSAAFFMSFVAFVCWILGLITNNYSQVDRLWSIIPFAYCWHFAYHYYITTGLLDCRLLTMTSLATLWGLRLSYNFYRKGGYSFKEEDYRWPILKKIITNRFVFEIFNLTFIATYQNILLYLIIVPIYYAYLAAKYSINPDWSIFDTVGTAGFLFFLLIETIADQQQWNYQTTKYELKAKNKLHSIYKVGFIHTGLFRYSRHPNFLSEQVIWWFFYVFSLNYTPLSFINQSVLGTALLTLLFQGSTKFTENITKAKYPQYAEYQKGTSRFIPLPSSFKPKIN